VVFGVLFGYHGCLANPKCSTGLDVQCAAADPGHALLATGFARNKVVVKSAHASPDAFDCQEDLANWRDTWSEEKQKYCCSHKKLGCGTIDAHYGPLEGLSHKDADFVVNDDGPWLRNITIRDPDSPAEVEEEFHEAVEKVELEEPTDKMRTLAMYVVMPLAVALLLIILIGHCSDGNGSTLPLSAIVVLISMPLVFYMHFHGHLYYLATDARFSSLASVVLNLVLLPIIIFNTAWSMRRQDFFSQLPYILLFATIGTLMSTTVIAVLIHWSGALGYHGVRTWRTAFAFASLISATDPAATLSTYAALKVDPVLNIIVHGESNMNAVVSIVLFYVLNNDVTMGADHPSSTPTAWRMTWDAFVFCFGSVGLGLFFGAIFALVLRHAYMRNNKGAEVLFLLVSCYATFAITESAEYSGIIATLFCTFLMSVYGRMHLSAEGSLLGGFLIKKLAWLADVVVYLIVGAVLVKLRLKGWYFFVWTALFCLVGRLASTVPVALFVNHLKEGRGRYHGIPEEGWHLLDGTYMFMIWHAGLRGAIALFLCLQLGDWVDKIEGGGTRHTLQTATCLIIFAFLLLFGCTTSALLQYLRIPLCIEMPLGVLAKTEGVGPLQKALSSLHERILQPVLVGDLRPAHHLDESERRTDIDDMLKKQQYNYK